MCMFDVMLELPLNSSHSCSCTVMMYNTYMSGISAQICRGWNTNLPDHSTTQLQSDLCISTCYVSLTTASDSCKFSCGPSSLYCNQTWKLGVKCPAQTLGEQKCFQSDFLKVEQQGLLLQLFHLLNTSQTENHGHMPYLIVTCPNL